MAETPPHQDYLRDPSHLCFTGLFLSPNRRGHLLSVFPAVFNNIDADHITTAYFGKDPKPPSTDTLSVGEEHTIPVLGHVIDEGLQVQAIIIGIDIPGKPYPHITISTGTNEDGSRVLPFLSNEAIAKAIRGGTVKPVPEDTKLIMTSGYCLGDYDNGQGTIVISKDSVPSA